MTGRWITIRLNDDFGRVTTKVISDMFLPDAMDKILELFEKEEDLK